MEFLNHLTYYQSLKKDSVPCSQFLIVILYSCNFIHVNMCIHSSNNNSNDDDK